jgi:translation elongation factor EF-4
MWITVLWEKISGKSTLSDRLLQLTNVIPADSDAQYLDKLEVERDRGITVLFLE